MKVFAISKFKLWMKRYMGFLKFFSVFSVGFPHVFKGLWHVIDFEILHQLQVEVVYEIWKRQNITVFKEWLGMGVEF